MPDTADNDDIEKLRRQRIKILVLAAIFLIPLAIAAYLVKTEWRPASTTNIGDLVVPPIPLDDVTLDSVGGKPVSLSSFKHHWLLVTFGNGQCTATCEQNIYKMRQTHIGQGKYQMRVKRLLVLTDRAAAGYGQRFKDYPQMTVVNAPASAINAFGRQIKTRGSDALQAKGRIYIIDPQGNLMMSYEADASAAGIRKDVSRLLRVSRIG